MWQTSNGDRVLRDAERALFMQGMSSLVDWIEDTVDWEVQVGVFDRLSKPEKLAIIEQVASALVLEDVPSPPLTAVGEGSVAAIYAQLKINVDLQIDGDEDGDERRLIVRACNERGFADEVPSVDSINSEAWHEVIDALADEILWDRDWAEAWVQPDDSPERANNVRDLARIEPDYYSAVARDPSPRQLDDIRAKLAALRSGKS